MNPLYSFEEVMCLIQRCEEPDELRILWPVVLEDREAYSPFEFLALKSSVRERMKQLTRSVLEQWVHEINKVNWCTKPNEAWPPSSK